MFSLFIVYLFYTKGTAVYLLTRTLFDWRADIFYNTRLTNRHRVCFFGLLRKIIFRPVRGSGPRRNVSKRFETFGGRKPKNSVNGNRTGNIVRVRFVNIVDVRRDDFLYEPREFFDETIFRRSVNCVIRHDRPNRLVRKTILYRKFKPME